MRGAPLSLKGRALRLLAMREHSRAELERKLAGHEEEPGQLRRVLDELESKDFINPQRVAESVIHRRAAGLGTARLRQELQRKGLDAPVVAQVLEKLEATELQRAREVWRRKFAQLPRDLPERGRQARFLASRGFGGGGIRRVISSAGEES